MNIIVDKGKEDTKLPQVMRAAIHMFVSQGVDGTTIKDIAKEAGVSEGALYRHYKSKDELAWSLFTTQLSQFTTELMGKVLAQKGAKERIRAFVTECFAAFEQDQDLFSYLILSEHKEFKKYPGTHNHPGHVVLRIIDDGQKSGEIRQEEPYLLDALFIGGVIRVCVARIYGNLKKDLREYAERVAERIWITLRADKDENQHG